MIILKLVNEKVPELDAEEDVSLEEEWCKSKKNLGRLSQGSFGSSNLTKEDDKEDVQNRKGMVIVNGQSWLV